ncbi:TPA: hypothetical protein KRH68_000718 [Clostridioides difficile]|uniref:hypothetical protein n=1 Tax=Clostridioides difficile TaxID=1496 RepID=UPI00038D6C84|nr:hypothetical protein [Clostridioides difficile]EQG38293.1 hypothetical protein QIO_0493 [Clostridioides difficile DA00129]HBF0262902.1 hypothetical protein [Clostridioides difficile]HBF0795415.1 hypothetical protein [Clostridioides difficile]HBF4022127.1 hypothetical protein [Clostridioides difficile]HBF4499157.1 hypothetical protein [Clostridioides difficile]
MKKFLNYINEENYDYFVNANTKEELENKIQEYLNDEDLDIEDLDINWTGKGEYCLVGKNFGVNIICKVEECVENELDNFEFPFNLNLDIFNNFDKWVKEIKETEKYKYIYLINHNRHVVTPNEYQIEYILYSNKEINNPIEYLLNEEDLFIGEFGEFGANYFVEELEDFSIECLTQYKVSEDLKTIRN